MLWRTDPLPTHPNGMRFSVFDEEGTLLATNEYFSVGGGFVVNEKTKLGENLFYKGVDKRTVHGARLHQTHSLTEPQHLVEDSTILPSEPEAPEATSTIMPGKKPDPMDEPFDYENEHPPYPFVSGNSLLALTQKHNVGSPILHVSFYFIHTSSGTR